MNKKEEQTLDEKIDKMVMEIDKMEMEMEKELQIILKTPVCHYFKPEGVLGKAYMLETDGLDACLECADSEQCWNYGQLKDLIEEGRKTLLNQDY